MTYRLPLILGLLIFAGCSDQSSKAADGPTAEQAVAYMVFGLEEGTVVPVGLEGDPPAFHQTSAEPLTYVAEKDPAKVTITITRQDDCNYAINFAARDNFKFSLDFGKLTSVAIIEQDLGMGAPKHGTTLTGARMTCNVEEQGFCEMFQKTSSWPFRLEDNDPGRLPGMVKCFQTNFCKGQPS
ncbi:MULTISPECIES: hypothetical protein [Rhizobium]|uniref:Lipoprotein n=1 Tax=Rhizobium aouanii TaxID=3118145 RepID=A0ABU8CJ28_9HYPH|nr:hypothetical protein [Rhizobium acaciae]MCW1410751.1 hypothetical protein [Rhizobium acaciae]MCW1742950.1 hypothetical protein [Rhizobium acaciae]MCW1750146.1 hypothetical protein [Rhizobium acaciae]